MDVNSQKIINKTIADYNLIADKFSSTRNKLTSDIVNLVNTARVGESSKILDYGCGNGRLCQLFQPDQYLGADPSEKLIEIAKKLHPAYNFQLIAPSTMPEKGDFDFIFCLAVIHHLPDSTTQNNLISDLAKALKSSGKLVLTAWNINQSDKIVAIPFNSGDTTIQRQIFSFSQENLELLIKSVGFDIISSKIIPRNRGVYSNIEIIAQKLSG